AVERPGQVEALEVAALVFHYGAFLTSVIQ
ncbi:MAG: hypothetical protein JWO56_2623, partial [Acidobacteria bacterium]|nr:hypothetical protein [Acidobacteriota bacterium]